MRQGRGVLPDRRGQGRRAGVLVCLLVLLLLGEGGGLPSSGAAEPGGVEGQARREAIAAAFVVNSSTFRFDGIEGSVRLEAMRGLVSCPGCYEYIFYFETRHPGHGDRTGLGITPALTPHRARVIVVDDEVILGVLDEAWDIATQLIVDVECSFELYPAFKGLGRPEGKGTGAAKPSG